MNDIPLGFGTTAKSTADCKTADPLVTICFHQADIGEYLRSEEKFL
jgi:60S ribosome subunit biogenesis protein NIP7